MKKNLPFSVRAGLTSLILPLWLLIMAPAVIAEGYGERPTRDPGTAPAVGSLPPTGNVATPQGALPRLDNVTVRKAGDQDVARQKTRIIREQLNGEDALEEKEPEDLIGKNDIRPDIGIPLVFNDAVEHYITYFTTTKKDLFRRWLQRKRRYAPLVRQILQEQGLPEDLVYLAMIESGFNLHAYSPAKAAGPWQFIPETGRRYGLTVNYWVDERRDIRKSTVAAARYLQELFNQFGCWYLAAAGYNAGENRIDRLIRRHDTKDFWELRAYNTLPRETREYVPQLIAAAIVAKNPERYGFGDIDYVAPLEYVGEKVPGGVPLATVARAASTDLSSVRALNPEFRRGITPPGQETRIKLPAGTDGVRFQKALSSILEEGRRVVSVVQHMIRGRENLARITKRYNVSRNDLALVNGSPLHLKRGGFVYIPRFDGAAAEEPEEPIPVRTADLRDEGDDGRPAKTVASRGGKSVFHVVRKGETLSSVAARYNTQTTTIKRLNGLKSGHIRHGMRLCVATRIKESPGPVGRVKAATAKYHTVRKGETLSEIAEKYGRSIQSIKVRNRLKNNTVQRGMRLRISSVDASHLSAAS